MPSAAASTWTGLTASSGRPTFYPIPVPVGGPSAQADCRCSRRLGPRGRASFRATRTDITPSSTPSRRSSGSPGSEHGPGNVLGATGPRVGGRIFAGLLAAAILCLTAVAGRAQVVDDWTSTSSSLWGTGGNWSVGVPSNANAATFNNSAGLQGNITLLAASSTDTLVFLSTGGATAFAFDTSGTANTNTLTISSGITNSDTAALTFYNTTTLGGSQSWTNDGGTMTFDGNVNLGAMAPGNTLTVNGSSAVTIAGIIADGGSAGSLTYGGTGTLTLAGINTFTGATTINSGGNLQLGNGAINGTIATTSAIADNGTLTFDETGATSLAKAISGTGGIPQTAGTNTLSGTNTYSGATTVNGGTLVAGSASAQI